MSCDVFREALKKLPLDDFDGLQAHLSICDGCNSIANELRQGHEAISAHLAEMVPHLDFDAVWEQAESSLTDRDLRQDLVEGQVAANNGHFYWGVGAAAAAAVLGLAVGFWFGTKTPTELEWVGIEADVASVRIEEELRQVEEEQHNLEARWEHLEAQRLNLHAVQQKARFLADVAALAAEQQRLSVETSKNTEVDWALWRAAEKEARAMADMARNADYAYTNAVLLASRAKP